MPPNEFDGPWKETLERFLPQVLSFFFPATYRGIDWRRTPEWMDKDLQRIAPPRRRGGPTGQQVVDKLVKVWRRNGEETWLLLHVEIQSQEDQYFARRMFRYHSRIFDRYERDVVSLAILGDENPSWKPRRFGYQHWGCRLGLTFPVAKLLDYDDAMLAVSTNPCALVVQAHRIAQATRGDGERRAVAKLALTRRLFRLGYNREWVAQLYRLIDWLIWLPDELDDRHWEHLRAEIEEEQMTYISAPERHALRQFRQGLLEGLTVAVRIKFGAAGAALLPEITELRDPAILQRLIERVETAATPDELRAIYAPQASAEE